jgi:hypothetical protein
LAFPKAQFAKARRRRRNEIKKKDRQFQSDIPPNATCRIGRGCIGPLVKHHRRARRYMATRWNNDVCWILCTKHHNDIEALEERRFCETYGLIYDPL